jgi:hypothetical protein
MGETIQVELPRSGLGDDLAQALGAHGLEAEVVEEGETCAVHVRYATGERDRLLSDGCALRPPTG